MSTQTLSSGATTNNRAGTVMSKDGTTIAFEQTGRGPALILVDGALCSRSFGPTPKLVPLLSDQFTVYAYDRRGRGGSGDTAPYAVAREVEDLDAVITVAGGSAFVFGQSSGAVLGLEAAERLDNIEKLAVYEAPFIVDETRSPLPEDYAPRIDRLIAEDRGGDAVKQFMRFVGAPALFVALMRFMPVWSKLTAAAPTLRYDTAIMKEHQQGVPLSATDWESITTPTLVADGGKSPAWIHSAARNLADCLPNAQQATLNGQTHMVKGAALAPVLKQFFGGQE